MKEAVRRVINSFFTVNKSAFVLFAILLLLAELLICLAVVNTVPYTEIDWSTYMQQVKCFLKGEKNYTRITGDTGPIAYPAGHLVIYRLLYSWTNEGRNIRRAQGIFVAFYLANLLLVFRLFYKSNRIPAFALSLICLTSYRVHSIFILRLFNDPIAMLLFHAAANLWVSHQWFWGSVLYSLAVSVKMNILLFAPAFFFILLISNKLEQTLYLLAVCAVTQMVVGSEFLLHEPLTYLWRAFQLNRVFLFKWTVNWRFLPEWLFLDKRFHLCLLLLHLVILGVYAKNNWFRTQGGLIGRIRQGIRTRLDTHEVLYALFTANLIGMSFARSLHYQFYCWYYYSLAYLLFARAPSSTAINRQPHRRESASSTVKASSESSIAECTPLDTSAIVWNGSRMALLLAVEYCWNVYPSTNFSSALLHLLHFVILTLSLRANESTEHIKKPL